MAVIAQMTIFSATYDPLDKKYFLYDREASRIKPAEPARFAFSFRDDYDSAHAMAWAEFMESLELADGFEFFYQTNVPESRVRGIDRGLVGIWLERATGRQMAPMIKWAKTSLLDTDRKQAGHSVLKEGEAAVRSLTNICKKYISLVRRRDLLNYGHYWPNWERARLLELRIQGLSFKNIGAQLKRTEHAARSEYGRLRRGEDNVTIELAEWEPMRHALPFGRHLPTAEEVVVVDQK